MDFSIYQYHFSHQPTPEPNEQGLFKVSSIEHIFRYWEQGRCFLHALAECETASHHENAHRDGVSDFTIEEYWMASKVTAVKYWDLSDLNAVQELIELGIKEQLSRGFFSTDSDLIKALIAESQDDALPALMATIGLDQEEFDDKHLFYDDSTLIKLLPYIRLSNEQIQDCLDNALHMEELAGKDEPVLRQYTSEGKSILDDHLHAELIIALLEYCKANPGNLDDETWSQLILVAVICDLPWQEIIHYPNTLELDSNLLVALIRLRKTGELAQLLKKHSVVLKGNLERLVDRCVVYSQPAIATFIVQLADTKDTLQKRMLSSVSASGKNILLAGNTNLSALLSWQSDKAGQDINQAAKKGYLILCSSLLDNNNYNEKELDSAIVEASEHGYTEVVKLLHKYGASLAAHGNWPIKYCNRFGYADLKAYLLSHGVENASFGFSSNEFWL